MKMVHVAAGIIVKGKQVFLSKRNVEQHQGGKWEFPGGKVEAQETALAALTRELKEEVNLDISNAELFHQVEFDYGDKQVRLEFFIVTEFTGQERGLEGQKTAWVDIQTLSEYNFPAANQVIVDKLISAYSQ